MDEKQKEKIIKMYRNAVALSKENKLEEAEKELLDAWESIPGIKEVTSESYTVALYLLQCYIKLEKVEEARKWAKKLFECAPHRIDDGERELRAGLVELMAKNEEKAKEYFKICNKKSDGVFFKKDSPWEYLKKYLK